jgi:aspartyl-tRNA(Asn)/glutamyl-tRNA(Gln) amidotransferase subunit A
MEGPNGLPVGVQVVGRRNDDARLLRTARWLAARILGGNDD